VCDVIRPDAELTGAAQAGMSVVVSKKCFDDHPMAGVATIMTFEKDGSAAASDLKAWQAILTKATAAGEIKLKKFVFKKSVREEFAYIQCCPIVTVAGARSIHYEDVTEEDDEGFEEEIHDFGCFDDQGMINYIGTNSRSKKWENPHDSGKVKVTFSSIANSSPEGVRSQW
jgi:hypothetical protein